MSCPDVTDFVFPMMADIFYPIVEQGSLGNVTKQWVFDRTIACNFSPAGAGNKEEVVPNIDMTLDSLLVGRTKLDIRSSSIEASNAITNIIVTNVRDSNCNQIYMESSGVRKGKATIFEVATTQPFIGPFGGTPEYFRVVLRRSQNQGADV
jgi:hypothetical protein